MKLVIVLGMAFGLTAFGQQANPPAQPPDGQAAPERQPDGQAPPQQPPAAEPAPAVAPQATPAQQPGQAPDDTAPTPAAGAPAPQQPAQQPAEPAQQPPAEPAQQQPAEPAQQQPAPEPSAGGAVSFRLRNAGLLEVIDTLARQLRINYVLDPSVREGSVTITTYGTLQQSDLFPLFETILRINGVVAVKVGNLYRIVPADGVTQLPITPQIDAKDDLPDDERMILNVIRLRYTVATELAKVLEPFLGAGAKFSVVEQANMILLLDNSRNMRRTMDLIALFDTEELASQRMRLFKITNSLPSSLTAELDTIFSALALSAEQSAIKFVPLDRIASILVVSGSETVFGQVEEWITKLDQPNTVGGVQNFIYKVQYGSAQALAMTMLQLYGAGFGYGGGGYGGYGGGFGGYGGYGGGGYGGYGGEYGGYGGGGFGGGGFGGGGFGGRGGGFGQGGFGGGGFGGGMGGGYGGFGGGGIIRLPGAPPVVAQQGTAPAAAAPGATNQTGQLLGSQTATATQEQAVGGIRIVPDMINNLIVVQATKQEWEVIRKTLHELDFPPRQVLIDAKIYEVQLTGAFQSGVRAALVERGQGLGFRTLTGGFDSSGAVTLSIGQLVGMNRELEILLNASASNGRSKVISAPSIIATDNIAATLTVGQSVPTLSSQALAGGAQSGGSSLFTNTISNVQTGVSLNILARVNASGIITMQIDQEVSSPVPPSAGGIQSPTIDRRNVSTQITVNDGDPIAIAGIIQETQIYGASRVPVLGSIPIVGALFGSTSISNAKSELVIIMRPRVIYDENEIVTASEELTDRLKLVRRLIRQ